MTRFVDEVWNEGDLDVADEIFHPAATSPSAPDLPPGGAGVRIIASMFRTAFPDFHMTIEDTIVEYPFIVVRFMETGTNGGPLMGMPATGNTLASARSASSRVAERAGRRELVRRRHAGDDGPARGRRLSHEGGETAHKVK